MNSTNKRLRVVNKAGKTSNGIYSPSKGLRESNKPRHYNDTTHNYGNFFEYHLPQSNKNWKKGAVKKVP